MKILIIDDEEAIRCVLCTALIAEGHEVNCLTNGGDKVVSGYNHGYDLVISDVILQGENTDGIAAMELARMYGNECPVIYISGADCSDDVEHFLLKPFQLEDLFAMIDEVTK